ncbi:hypothetical protein B0H34DRAFT_223776 [Crassisporium funariophilum]|nr:hypothetical protein B0H34DRAFT_223776 [Crassisporium funariophilum]
MLGKIVHIGFDALLIAAFLAGVKRTTGLTYVFDKGGRSFTHICVAGLHCRKSRTKTFVNCYDHIWSSVRNLVPSRDEIMPKCIYIGEYTFDFAVVIFGRSSSFERKR